MSLLPSSGEDTEPRQEGDIQVLGVDGERTSEVLNAISSDTARTILSRAYRDPSTPSEIAAKVDESVQNVSYHLEKLEEADAVEVVDTRLSERGHEMKVYGPAEDPIALFVGTEERRTDLTSLLKRFFSVAGVLIVTSYTIGFVVEDSIFFGIQLAVSAGRGPDIPFALAFLLGGFFVLFVLTVGTTWRRYRDVEPR